MGVMGDGVLGVRDSVAAFPSAKIQLFPKTAMTYAIFYDSFFFEGESF